MPRFSQRHGYSPLEQAFQREQINEALRTHLWNTLKVFIWDKYEVGDYYTEINKRIEGLVKRLWFHFFNSDLDELPVFRTPYRGKEGSYHRIKSFFFTCEWFEAYDLIEEISTDVDNLLSDNARAALNLALAVC